jgi:hypothetical protein
MALGPAAHDVQRADAPIAMPADQEDHQRGGHERAGRCADRLSGCGAARRLLACGLRVGGRGGHERAEHRRSCGDDPANHLLSSLQLNIPLEDWFSPGSHEFFPEPGKS